MLMKLHIFQTRNASDQYDIKTHLPWTKLPPFRRRHFQMHFMNDIFCILIHISLKFVPKGPIGNKLMLVRVMAWRRTGDKPLSEPMLIENRIE